MKLAWQRKARVKKFLFENKGHRTNFQLADWNKAATRAGRNDRSLVAKSVYRVFTKDSDYDQPYPFDSLIPKGRQDVPPIRGYRLSPDLTARLYFEACRERMEDKDSTDAQIMNRVYPGIINPFVYLPHEQGSRTLASKILRQIADRRERNLSWPSHKERLAKKYGDQKPEDMDWQTWVQYMNDSPHN